MKKKISLLWVVLSGIFVVSAQQVADYNFVDNIPYYESDTIRDEYIKERCKLDLYYPTNIKDYPTVVWFHGGGLSGGNKQIPERLKQQGIAVVAVNYRLHPQVKHPAYIKDAAASIAWVFKHIASYGGDSTKIVISGHSAGGYLASMVGLDQSYLYTYGIEANQLAAIVPFSGHAITHFTIRKEMGIEGTQPIIDQYAPLFHVRNDAPPLILITGDRNMEMLGRYEENAYLMRMMKVVGNKDVTLYELQGYGHNMVEPALPILVQMVKKYTGY